MGIKWLNRGNFGEIFEAEYRPKKRFLVPSLTLEISFNELSKIIPAPPSLDIDECDGLGLRNMWFGITGEDSIFVIINYKGLPTETHIEFLYKDDLSEKYQWSFLEKLTELNSYIFKRIIWIRSEFFVNHKISAKPVKTIFYKDKYGITWQVYSAISENDTSDLLNFLHKLKPDFEYWIDNAEDINQA